MMITAGSRLNSLCYEFFIEFARYEFCLKMMGFTQGDWATGIAMRLRLRTSSLRPEPQNWPALLTTF